MNLTKLFEMQRELDQHIEEEHPREEGRDRLAEKILSLQVELGECANEWRGFKFWSKDQKPRRLKYDTFFEEGAHGPQTVTKDPLLEEYVDCLHFILSIGIEKKWNGIESEKPLKADNVTTQFHLLFRKISDFQQYSNYLNYKWIWGIFMGLGEMLGFTLEQVEEAYMSKNAVNHQRQESGY